MKLRNVTNGLFAAMLCMFSGTLAQAGIVIGPDGNYRVEQQRNVPQRGLRDHEVLKRFGEPVQRHRAVGTPPISSWEYERFEVYFESGIVIHAVVD